jgi:hypothetical protein
MMRKAPGKEAEESARAGEHLAGVLQNRWRRGKEFVRAYGHQIPPDKVRTMFQQRVEQSPIFSAHNLHSFSSVVGQFICPFII